MRIVKALVRILIFIFVFALVLLDFNQVALAGAKQEKNKKLVREFYELAFNKHKPTEAAKKFIGDEYTQHNPFVVNGAEAFYKYFEKYFVDHPESRVNIVRAMGDGDLVMLHLNFKMDEKDRGSAVVDIFRVEKGKIVEHWDVIQPVAAETASGNGMF